MTEGSALKFEAGRGTSRKQAGGCLVPLALMITVTALAGWVFYVA